MNGSSVPLIDWNFEAEDFNGDSILIMGMTAHQIRGLCEFFTAMTGKDSPPLTIGEMRDEINRLAARLDDGNPITP